MRRKLNKKTRLIYIRKERDTFKTPSISSYNQNSHQAQVYVQIDNTDDPANWSGRSRNTSPLQKKKRERKILSSGTSEDTRQEPTHYVSPRRGPLSDCPSCLVMSYASLSRSSSAPHVTAQLYLALLEAVSGAKLRYLRDPATPTPLGSSPPTSSTTLYSLGRVQLLQVGPALTIEQTLDGRTRCFFPSLSPPTFSTGSPS
jgi:hypothetical protein